LPMVVATSPSEKKVFFPIFVAVTPSEKKVFFPMVVADSPSEKKVLRPTVSAEPPVEKKVLSPTFVTTGSRRQSSSQAKRVDAERMSSRAGSLMVKTNHLFEVLQIRGFPTLNGSILLTAFSSSDFVRV
jgi:hypothetical protein